MFVVLVKALNQNLAQQLLLVEVVMGQAIKLLDKVHSQYNKFVAAVMDRVKLLGTHVWHVREKVLLPLQQKRLLIYQKEWIMELIYVYPKKVIIRVQDNLEI
jgi:hypothetical protein